MIQAPPEVTSSYIKNFPFPTLREKQPFILNQIEEAFGSGYRYVLLESPTGTGKSALGIAVALTLGSSYICTSTKDLQSQYCRDFPFVKSAKGKSNFECEVKQDFIRNASYKCKSCGPYISKKGAECNHTTVEYGPCMADKDFGCKYKTSLKNYIVINKGTKEERVFLSNEEDYESKYSEWIHLNNLKESAIREWRPCEYFHRLNVALVASHSVLNYSMFLALLNKNLPSRELLVLDEAHLLETEIVKFKGISISKKKWRRYIPDLRLENHGQDVKGWANYLLKLRDDVSEVIAKITNKETLIEATQDLDRLELAIGDIASSHNNWIVSDVKIEGREVAKVELKPLDVGPYCKEVFSKCNKTLMMSATILDPQTFCKSVGLAYDDVKFIKVGSDFPLQNRPIYPLAIAHLNYENLQKEEVKSAIAKSVDAIMTSHKDHKGIIHTTSYEQLNFIKENVSEENRRRLLVTDPEVERDEVIAEHVGAKKPTVLISPSLHLGLDLKDNLSRFQVIVKTPYPSLGDRWIEQKMRRSEKWYNLATGLRLMQSYGRSIRSKDDWAATYILDSMFGIFVNRNRDILPTWFLEAICKI